MTRDEHGGPRRGRNRPKRGQSKPKRGQNKPRREPNKRKPEPSKPRPRTEQAEARTEQAETRSEQAIRASEISYRRLFEAAKDGIMILEADTGRISDVNPFLVEMLGFSHGELVGTPIWELGPFKDIVSNKARFEQLQQQGYVRSRKSADGNKGWSQDRRGVHQQRVSSR